MRTSKTARKIRDASLFEQSLFAAVRAPNPHRRRDFAQLLRTGLSKNEAELIELEMLFRLGERLNEPQLLILYSYGGFPGTFGDPELEAFYETHPEMFGLEVPTMTDGEDTIRRWAMRDAYVAELVTLGLLEDEEGVVKSAGPRRVRVTKLGSLLLESIGRTK